LQSFRGHQKGEPLQPDDNQWHQNSDQQAQGDLFGQNPDPDIRSATEGQQHEDYGQGQTVVES
jgi:hypothetical protein